MNPTPEQVAAAEDAIRTFDFDDYGLDDVFYAIHSAPWAQEWIPALARRVAAAVTTPGPGASG